MGILSYFISPLSAFSDHQTKKASKKAVAAVQAAADQNTALARNIYDTTRADLAPGRAVYGPSVGALAARAGLGGASTGVRGTAGTSPLEPSGAAPAGFDPTGYAGGSGDTFIDPRTGAARADSLPASPTGPPMAPRTPMCRPSGSTLSRPATRATTSSRTTRTSTTNGTMTPSARTRWVSRAIRACAARSRWRAADRSAATRRGRSGPDAGRRRVHRPERRQLRRRSRARALRSEPARPVQGPGRRAGLRLQLHPDGPGLRVAPEGSGAGRQRGLWREGPAEVRRGDQGGAGSVLQPRRPVVQHRLRPVHAPAEGDRGQFNADRSANFNIYNTNRNFDYGQTRDTRGDWETDRGFGAGRYDQDTSNLFGLSTLGQNAAAGSATAGNIFTSAASANNNNVANARANKALSDNSNSFFNQIIPAVANVAGRYASGGF
jgi:hypothetical protein